MSETSNAFPSCNRHIGSCFRLNFEVIYRFAMIDRDDEMPYIHYVQVRRFVMDGWARCVCSNLRSLYVQGGRPREKGGWLIGYVQGVRIILWKS
jgi:hypothetical protein